MDRETGLRVGSFKATLNVVGIDVPLKKEEQLRYEKLFSKWADTVITNLAKSQAFEKMREQQKQEVLDQWMKKARQYAGMELKREMSRKPAQP